MATDLLSHNHTTYAECPHCKSKDVKGPIDSPVGERNSPPFYVVRSFFCRKCWLDTQVKLRDDIAEQKLAKR